MDNKLFDLVHQQIPRFNDVIMNGLAVEHMRHVESYVDGLFRSIATGFPPELKYLGYEHVTPDQEYAEVTRKRNNRSTFDIARSDLYMVRYCFSFEGERIEPERYMYLPYVKDAGLITIRGSTFSIAPVLADIAISVGANNIFIPLQVTKLTFERKDHNFYLNGERESPNVVYSTIYNRSDKAKALSGKPKVVAESTLMHYLLCKYGLTRTFKEFGKADVFCGTSLDINPDNYPEDEWYICSTSRLHPPGVKSKVYIASDIRLAIRKSEYNLTTGSMIGGFFYIVDHFPQRVEPEFVDHIRLWRTLLGHIIFGGEGSEGKLVEDINIHMESLDEYMDEQSQERLARSGVHVTDVYQLFVYIIETLSVMVIQSGNAESSMYNKQMMVLRYVLFDINKSISLFKFALKRNGKKPITKAEVIKAMQRFLNQDAITKINRQHGEVSGISSPGDNKYFKITSNLVPQTSATGTGRSGKKSTLVDSSKFLDASIAEIGSLNNLPKSSPDGRTRVGTCVKLDPADLSTVVRDETKRPLIDSVQRKIQR